MVRWRCLDWRVGGGRESIYVLDRAREATSTCTDKCARIKGGRARRLSAAQEERSHMKPSSNGVLDLRLKEGLFLLFIFDRQGSVYRLLEVNFFPL